MRKTIPVLAALALMSGFALAQENGSNGKGLDEAKQEFIQAKRETNKAQALEKGKLHAEKLVDTLIASLNRIEENIDGSDCLSDESKAALKENVDEEEDVLEAIKIEITAADTSAELKTAVQKVKDEMGKIRDAAKAVRDAGRKCRLEEVLKKLEKGAARLEERINALSGDKGEFNTMLSEASDELESAQAGLDANDLKKAQQDLINAKTILVKLNGLLTAAEAKEEGSNDQSENRPLFKEEE